jgi:hypothetical protein
VPNGGITPDCVHCESYRGKPYDDGEPYCDHHEIKLAYPIRAFCSHFADREPSSDKDWLDEALDRSELQNDMMYVWLSGYEVKFFAVPLIPIAEYADWTREKFLEEFEKIVEKYRDNLK